MRLHEVCIPNKPAYIKYHTTEHWWDGEKLFYIDGKEMDIISPIVAMSNDWNFSHPTLKNVSKKYGYEHKIITGYAAIYIPVKNRLQSMGNIIYSDSDFPPELLEKLLKVIKHAK